MLTDHCMRRASGRNPLAFAPPPHALRNDHRPTPRAITTTATGPARAPSRWASRRGSTWRPAPDQRRRPEGTAAGRRGGGLRPRPEVLGNLYILAKK